MPHRIGNLNIHHYSSKVSVLAARAGREGWSNLVRTLIRPAGNIRIVRNIFAIEIFVLVLNLGTGLISARLLGPEGRGELAAMVIWPMFAASLFTFGVPRAITFNLARQESDASCLVLVGLMMTLCMGLVATLVGFFIIPIWLHEHSAKIISFAQWAMLVTPTQLMMWLVNGVLQARGEFRFYNANRYLPPLGTFFALALLAFLGNLTPFTAALAALGPVVPLLAVNLIWITTAYRPRFSAPAQSFRSLFSYGWRSYGTDLGNRLSKELDRVVLVALLSPAALGVYVVARSLCQPALALSNAVVAVLFPAASRANTRGAVALSVRAAWITTAVSCVLAVGLMLVAPPLLELLYGHSFLPAVRPFRILIIDTVLAGFGWVLAQGLMSVGRPGIVTAALVFSLGALIPSLLLIVPALGPTGAALAVLFSTAVRVAFIVCCFPLVLKLPFSKLLPSVKRPRLPPLMEEVGAKPYS